MKALKIIIIILAVLLGIFLIPPMFMPSEMYVEKTRVMQAQPEVIWDQVNCLENWEAWDLWHQDTNIVGHYEGPACGVGAKNIWKYTNMDAGGSQEIVEVRPFEYIKTYLDFGEMGSADAEFFFEKTEEGTKVTWNILSPSAYPVGRWMTAIMLKPGITVAYETGLENLDNLTKDMKPLPKYTTGDVSLVDMESMKALAIRSETDMGGIAQAMGNGFGQIMQVAQAGGLEITGAPFAIWYTWDGETFVFDNCLPVNKAIAVTDPIKIVDTYAGKAATVDHFGSYETTQYSWGVLENYLNENGLETNGEPMEFYITDPGTEPDPAKWQTTLYWPVK